MQEKSEADQLRELRFRLRQANKTVGHQGQTIHQLRAELAEVRALNSKIERGDLRRLERDNANLVRNYVEVSAENQSLREKLQDDELEGTDGLAEVITHMAGVGSQLREERS